MITLIVSAAAGWITGLLIGAVTVHLRRRTRQSPDPVVHGLTDADRDQIEAEIAAHTVAANRKIAEFADALADGDTNLRTRLRRFETGRKHS